jgi:hypothetical protein
VSLVIPVIRVRVRFYFCCCIINNKISRITFNKRTEEVIVPVILYSPFTAFPSACVNAIAGVDVGSSLLQLTIDTAQNLFLDH